MWLPGVDPTHALVHRAPGVGPKKGGGFREKHRVPVEANDGVAASLRVGSEGRNLLPGLMRDPTLCRSWATCRPSGDGAQAATETASIDRGPIRTRMSTACPNRHSAWSV